MPKIFYNLQAARFLAALAVAAFHTEIFYRRAGGTWVIDPLRIGYARIDLFFVISGFVTAHVAGRTKGPREASQFLYRRFARIFMAYWPIMLVMIAIFALFAPATLQRYDFLRGILLIHASNASRIVATSWTLTQELLFFIVFAAACIVGRKHLPWMAGVLVALIIGNQFVGYPYAFPILLSPLLLEFMAGVAVRLALARFGTPASLDVRLLVLSVVGLFIGAYVCRQIGVTLISRSLIVGPAAALVVYCAASMELQGRVLSRSLAALGDSAFGIYLVHWPMLVLAGFTVERFVQANAWSAELVYGLIFALVAPVAIGFHRLVERPLFRWSTAWMKRETVPPSTLAAST